MKHPFSTALLMAAVFSANAQKTAPPAPVYPLPNAQQLAWHEMEMNAFVHFTVNTFTDKEWGYGDESESLFNPSDKTNPGQWADVLKRTGFKTLILTCKHHDGFCLWPT
ncbi:MAG: alpha-L-fucosidase, partial [Bacteroidetes bacterium]|nr:alpha-L-fucosidase [Bacteroidota bacterium]